MNDLLQKHGCSNVFTVPEGLKELMSDITREVLREQPKNICDFIYNYLSALLITREHGVMAVRILEDLCDCRPSVSEHLIQLGLEKDIANSLAQVIKNEIENFERKKEKEKIKETSILKKILSRAPLDEEMAAKVCQITRNAFKDYWYKKKLMEQSVTMRAEEPWEVAAERTLALYKKTKPSLDELHRATERIQAAYRGYYVRRNLLKHLKPKKRGLKDTQGAPLDIAGSREIDLGPVTPFTSPVLNISLPQGMIQSTVLSHLHPSTSCMSYQVFTPSSVGLTTLLYVNIINKWVVILTDIQVGEDDVNGLFAAHAFKLGPHYDSIKTTAIDNERNKNPLEKSPTGYKMMDRNTGELATRPVITTNPEVGVVQMESRRVFRSDSHEVEAKWQGMLEREQLDTYNEKLTSRYSDAVTENRHIGTPARKISFSMVPPEMIPNEYLEDDQEIQEAIQEPSEEIEAEILQEIPEDLPDADANNSPVVSAASLISTDLEEENHQ